MGDVVQFKPRTVEKERVEKPPAVTEHESFESFLFSEEIDAVTLISLVAAVKPIVDHLNGLLGHVSPKSVAMRRELLSGRTLEELIGFAKESGPAQWSATPAYYHAIVDEITSRFDEQLF